MRNPAVCRPLACWAVVGMLLAGAGCRDRQRSAPAGGNGPAIGPATPAPAPVPPVGPAGAAADEARCKVHLSGLHKALITYAATHDEAFPPDLQTLSRENLAPVDLLACRRAGPLQYVAGLRAAGDGAAIVVYEPACVHQGRCHVLRVGGAIDALTQEELDKALAGP